MPNSYRPPIPPDLMRQCKDCCNIMYFGDGAWGCHRDMGIISKYGEASVEPKGTCDNWERKEI